METVNLTANYIDNSIERTQIAVCPIESYDQNVRLFTALEDMFPVRCIPCRKEDIGSFKYALFLEADDDVVTEAQQLGLRCLVCPSDARQEIKCASEYVHFADSIHIDESFRGASFQEFVINQVAPLTTQSGDVVLATKGGSPSWLRRTNGDSVMDLIAVKPKLLEPNEILREQFNRYSFSHILPLLHFVRELVGQTEFNSSEKRQACIVIDDPSLYFTSYGFVNFKKLAEHAKHHGYHVVIASIAVDTWKINSKVASLFREYSENLSLIIHGNNHIWHELAGDRSTDRLLAITAQALRRFKRYLLKGYQLNFSPILEAPYGKFVTEATEPMVNLGYLGALFTPSQFIQLNREAGFPAAFGCDRVEVLPQGLCAIPRLVMSDDWRIEIAIAAFLRQPIVLACHHQDFFEGLDLLAEFSSCINHLSNVEWCSVGEIAKSNYLAIKENSTLTLKLGSRLVECQIPSGVERIVVERPWINEGKEERLIFLDHSGANKLIDLTAKSATEPLIWNCAENSQVIIESPVHSAINPDTVNPPPRSYWPIARKLMQETRDRLYPFLPKRLIRHLRMKKMNLQNITVSRAKPTRDQYGRT